MLGMGTIPTMAMQRWRPRANLRLVRTAATLIDEVRRRYSLSWAWVKGHADDQHNAAAVVPLGGDELWERVVGGEEKTGDDEDNEDEDKNALDLLREDVFTHFAALNSGLLTAKLIKVVF